MVATTTNIERVKALRAFANGLKGATERWQEAYRDKKYYDKQGFGFTFRTDVGWNAFTVPSLGFEAYVGTYGSSSCSGAWSVDKALVQQYILKALNQHKQAIFDSMAEFAEADATDLREKANAELEALRALLNDAEKEAA